MLTLTLKPCPDPEVGGGGGCWEQVVRALQKNHKALGLIGNTGPEITRLPSQHSMLDHHQPDSQTPLK